MQYTIKKSGSSSWGKWTTVKKLENVQWNLNFQNAVALFGRNNINPSGLKSGDQIMIRLFLRTEEGYRTGDINQNGPNSLNSSISINDAGQDLGGNWMAPFIVVYTYSGKKRPVR